MTTAPETLTVLQHPTACLAKRWTKGPDGPVSQGYDAAKYFKVRRLPVADLAAARKLFRRLQTARGCCVIRGAPKPGTDLARTQRTLEHFADEPRHLLELDVDEGFEAVADALAALPKGFRGAGHITAPTGSAGIKPGLRARLVFWLDTPLTGAQCRHWLRGLGFDLSVMTCVQPIYTAAPVFDGLSDPLPDGKREPILVEGGPVAVPADIAAWRPPEPGAAPVLGEEATNHVRDRLIEDLGRREPGGAGRDRTVGGWIVDAVAHGLAESDIIAAAEAWLVDHGREAQPREVPNWIASAKRGLASGSMAPSVEIADPVDDFRETEAPASPPTPEPKLSSEAAREQEARVLPEQYDRDEPGNARTLLRFHFADGKHLLRFDEDDYEYHPVDGRWHRLGKEDLAAKAYRHMSRQVDKKATITNSVNCLRMATGAPTGTTLPGWVGGPHQGDSPDRWIAFRNGLVDVEQWAADPRASVVPHTPHWFSISRLEYDFDPAATCPEWHKFVASLWDDPELTALLQEWLGYQLVCDYRWQKFMLLLGRPRSGKGTILRVLEKLVGPTNCRATSVHALGDRFGLWTLVGAQCITIGEANPEGGHAPSSAVNTLKSITGGDAISVDRKNKEQLNTRLPGRITMCANRPPAFVDPSGAVWDRMLLLPFDRSYAGREDVGLDDRLAKELPGIALWAMEGLRRLRARGSFTEPGAAAEHRNAIRVEAAPVLGFIQDFIAQGAGASVSEADAFDAYARYCSDSNLPTLSRPSFVQELVRAGVAQKKGGTLLGCRLADAAVADDF